MCTTNGRRICSFTYLRLQSNWIIAINPIYNIQMHIQFFSSRIGLKIVQLLLWRYSISLVDWIDTWFEAKSLQTSNSWNLRSFVYDPSIVSWKKKSRKICEWMMLSGKWSAMTFSMDFIHPADLSIPKWLREDAELEEYSRLFALVLHSTLECAVFFAHFASIAAHVWYWFHCCIIREFVLKCLASLWRCRVWRDGEKEG